MSGLFSGISGALGMNNTYQGSVQAPNAALFQSPGMTQQNQTLAQQLAAAQGMQAPTANAAGAAGVNIDNSQSNQVNGAQNALANQLMQTANGGGTSPADLQLQQGLQQQLAQARAAAVSAGANGANPMLAQRQIAQQAAQAGQNTNAALGIQRAGETQNAQNSLGNLLGTQRSQDQSGALSQAQLNQSTNQFNAGNVQQTNLANQGAGLQQQQITNAAMNNINNSTFNNNAALLNAGVQQGAQALQGQMANNATNAGVAQQNTQTNNGIIGGLVGGLTSALPIFSDERLKAQVDRDVDKDMADFLKNLDPASYEYKNPALGAGRHWSVMAQSAAKSKAGRSFVLETPQGLALDTSRGFGVALTALKHLADRQEKMEKVIARG